MISVIRSLYFACNNTYMISIYHIACKGYFRNSAAAPRVPAACQRHLSPRRRAGVIIPGTLGADISPPPVSGHSVLVVINFSPPATTEE